MRKILQQRSERDGNCLETCLACIFDLKVSEVPDFNSYSDYQWMFKLSEWLYKEFKLSCICFRADEEYGKLIRGYHIIICNSGYEGITHAIVSRDGKPYYDPMGKLQEQYEDITHLVFISTRTTYSF